jgi:hypothetical protein
MKKEKIETPDQKRKRLIEAAYDLDQHLEYMEATLRGVVTEIQELSPTKKELKDGVQDLIDCYGG